jgi:TIR domain
VSLIFVSYRRQDTQSATGRLCDKLQMHFSVDQVFHDIESIEPGSSFPAIIASKIAESSIVLVMIGRHWLDSAGDDGRSRLFEPDDYLRLEIATALQRDIPVIPVLVEGAVMPPASALPEPIAALAALQAIEITEQRWQYDSDLLVKEIERFVAPEGMSTVDDATLRQTLLQSVVGWPLDFAQLLVRPRRQLNALLNQPNFVMRAAVFFALSHIVAGWLFVQPDLVASVPAFVLTGVPEGAFILALVMVPLHLAARLLRAPSHAPTTMMMLAYIQSVAMVLVAAGIALIWTGLELVDPEFGPHARAVLDANLPLEARLTRMSEVAEAAVGGPFLAAFVLANVIWLYTGGWLVVAIQAFRDRWRTSRIRFAAILILVALVLSIAGALVLFAGTL